MPLIHRGKLLAGVAALCALSVAGPGCRTSNVCQTCCSSADEGGSGHAVDQTGRFRDGTAVARMAFPIRSRVTTTEPGIADQPGTCQTCVNPTAIMLRPVPMRTPAEPNSGTASTWTPVQRVSGEVPATLESELTPVASLGSPMPSAIMVNTQVPPGGPLLPLPTAPALAATVGDAGDTMDKKSADLPMPKEKASKKTLAATGYPDLPPVMITQPMNAPREGQMRALSTYIVEPPDILLVEIYLRALKRTTPIRAEQLVRPDGSIGFGAFPPLFVAGLTLEQIKLELAKTILPMIDTLRGQDDEKKDTLITLDDLLKGLKVDVLRYNSKFYYVITDGGGYGEQVTPVPITGNERVLDAVAKIQGLPAVASKKKIWVARATPNGHDHLQILPVDWNGIVKRGSWATNYQMFPGDRLYIDSDCLIQTDSRLGKLLAPVQRILGATLLGSSTYNSIKTGSNNTGNGNNGVGR